MNQRIGGASPLEFDKHDNTFSIDSELLASMVKPFNPDQIGLSRAWDEFYTACQAANASHELLRAIHDIKESIEDAEQGHAH